MADAFFADYLRGPSEFWPNHFSVPEHRRECVERAAKKNLSPQLLAILRRQNEGASAAGQRHLHELGGAAACVITGQQVGLFLGPLYTLYKAATAVSYAQQLRAETKIPCVPLFWLQTEDHDFVEIASTWTLKTTESEAPFLHKLTAQSDAPPVERISVVQRRLTVDIDRLIAEATPEPTVRALLARHYRPGAYFWRAFAGVLQELFAEHGLLIFNPRDAEVAPLLAPVWRASIERAEAIDEALLARTGALCSRGVPPQIKLRAESPLVFMHTGTEGPRARMAKAKDNLYSFGAEMLSPARLLDLAATEPFRFSTSALLRPIAQDSLLPTAAYVGGAAELNYYAQLAPLYELFGLRAPLLLHRSRLCLWPKAPRRAASAVGLSLSQAERDAEKIEAEAMRADAEIPSAGWASALDARLHAYANTSDPELRRVAHRTRLSIAEAMARLERRANFEARQKGNANVRRAAQILRWVKPQGQPQERFFCFAPFAAETRASRFISLLSAGSAPFSGEIVHVPL